MDLTDTLSGIEDNLLNKFSGMNMRRPLQVTAALINMPNTKKTAIDIRCARELTRVEYDAEYKSHLVQQYEVAISQRCHQELELFKCICLQDSQTDGLMLTEILN